MSEANQVGASSDGTVMLDIGGDIGALIIMTALDMLHVEIELSPADEHDHTDQTWAHSFLSQSATDAQSEHSHGGHSHVHHRPGSTHVAVRERIGPGGVRYAAIFPGLRAGEYSVWGVDGTVRDAVTIAGGEVTTLDWR